MRCRIAHLLLRMSWIASLENGTESLTIVALYPQYSGTTVGSIFDTVSKYFVKSDKIINLTFFRTFYNHPLYIDYYVSKIKNTV